MVRSNDLQKAARFAWKGFSTGITPLSGPNWPPRAILGMIFSLLAAGEDQSSWESSITAQGLAIFLPLVAAKDIYL